MNVHLNIRGKAIVLVAVPLLFEFVFVGWLWMLVQQAEHNFDRLQDSKDMLTEIQRTKSSLGQAVATALLSNAADTEIAVSALKEVTTKLEKSRHEIAAYKPRRSDIQVQLEDVDRLLERAAGFSRKAANVYADASIKPGDRGKHLRKELYALLGDSKPTLDALIKHELQVQQSTPRELQRVQTTIGGTLIAGMLLSAGFAAALAIFFGKNFSARLARTSDSARLLVSGEPLPKPDRDRDEIARLDATLHEAALQLEDYRRKEATFIASASDVVCSLDRDGRFTYVSPASLKLWWLTPVELQERTIYDITPMDQRAVLKSALHSAEAGDEQSLETQVRRDDGQLIDMLWSIAWVDEKQLHFCIAHDNSEEAQLKRLKRRFVSMVSHDLRTPIASVEGSIALLTEGARGAIPDGARASLRASSKTLTELNGLLQNVLDVERLEAGKLMMSTGCASIVDIYSECAARLAPLMEQTGVSVRGPDRDEALLVDADRIEQAFTALLRRVILASPAASQVGFSIKNEGDRTHIFIKTDTDTVSQSDTFNDVESELACAIIRANQGLVEFEPAFNRIRIVLPTFQSEDIS